MQSIRFGRHFLALAVAALIFGIICHFEEEIPAGSPRFYVIFAAMGALHAASIVTSLRGSRISVPKSLVFIVLAAVASIGTFFSIVLASPLPTLLRLHGEREISFMIFFASASGASAYWVLLRVFWLDLLRLRSLGITVGMCCAGTLLSWVAAGMVNGQGQYAFTYRGEIASLLPTFGWWLAFSLSIYWNQVLAGRSTPQSLALQQA